jgi:hypothetical protein
MDWAVRHGNLDMVKYIIEQNGPMQIQLYQVVDSNNLELVKYLYPILKQDFTQQCYYKATLHDNVDILQFMESHIHFDNLFYDYISEDEASVIQEDNEEEDIQSSDDSGPAVIAASIHSVPVLNFYLKYYHDVIYEQEDFLEMIIRSAYRHDNLDMIKILIPSSPMDIDAERYTVFPSYTGYNSINHLGSLVFTYPNVSLEMVKYIIGTCNFTELDWHYILNKIISNNHTHYDYIMTQLPQDWPLVNTSTCEVMVENSRLDLLQQFPHIRPNSDMLETAINQNNLQMVIELIKRCENLEPEKGDDDEEDEQQRIPWPDTITKALNQNFYEIIKYIHEKGYPCQGECHKFYPASRFPFCK